MPAGVSAVLATVMATIGFFALAVFGLGALSVATDADIISIPGLGQAPGVIGMIIAVAVFLGLVWLAVRIKQPLYRSFWTVSIATTLAHLLAVGVVAAIAATEFVTGLAVMGQLVTGGASLVILATAAVASGAAVALRRTKSKQPKWPWEKNEPDAQ